MANPAPNPNSPTQDLQQAYANVCRLLNTITASPKPTYQLDGKQVSWSEYFGMLNGQMKALEEAIQRNQGPFMIPTRCVT